jgi:hypothetical protein
MVAVADVAAEIEGPPAGQSLDHGRGHLGLALIEGGRRVNTTP